MSRGYGIDLPLDGVLIWNPLTRNLIKQIPRQARDKVTSNILSAVGFDLSFRSTEESIKPTPRSGSIQLSRLQPRQRHLVENLPHPSLFYQGLNTIGYLVTLLHEPPSIPPHFQEKIHLELMRKRFVFFVSSQI